MTDAERIAELESQVATLTKERDNALWGLGLVEIGANLAIASGRLALEQLKQTMHIEDKKESSTTTG